MTDEISAYNERLEAMAAACEASADLFDGSTIPAVVENAAHLRDAAAFIRSQELRPIEDATKGQTILGVWLGWVLSAQVLIGTIAVAFAAFGLYGPAAIGGIMGSLFIWAIAIRERPNAG